MSFAFTSWVCHDTYSGLRDDRTPKAQLRVEGPVRNGRNYEIFTGGEAESAALESEDASLDTCHSLDFECPRRPVC
jgi:hypothetical protein